MDFKPDAVAVLKNRMDQIIAHARYLKLMKRCGVRAAPRWGWVA